VNKILVIGSSNTDMVVKSQRFPVPGETILGGEFFMFPGGKGANQAVAAARLGGDVTFVTRVGDDVFGRQAVEGFKKEGIDSAGIIVDQEHPSGVAMITVNDEGENQIVVASGSNAFLVKKDIDLLDQLFTASDIILVQLEIPIATVEHVIAKGRELGKKVVLNPAPAHSISHQALSGLFCITPNQKEAQLLTGVKVVDRESALEAGQVLLSKGVHHVIITMGGKGSIYISIDEVIEVSAPLVQVVDTTAAGDVYNGALCVALAAGQAWKKAMEFATKSSAIAVTKMGAQASAPLLSELDC